MNHKTSIGDRFRSPPHQIKETDDPAYAEQAQLTNLAKEANWYQN